MESLEDIDLVRSLNFSSSSKFLSLVEEELAGLVLAAKAAEAGGGCRILFPPLKPRYATLLQVTAARFGLSVVPHGWSDERRLSVDASAQASLPCVQCTDFRPLDGGGKLAARLADIARPSAPAKQTGGPGAKAAEAAASPPATEGPVATAPRVESLRDDERQCEGGGRKGGGMRGWSDGEQSDDDWISKRRKASTASGGIVKGRGFAADGGVGADADKAAGSDDFVLCTLQKDYTRYAIDPDDTWRPHRKPYTELEGGWEFSGAWSFDPDENEQFEEGTDRSNNSFRGVAAWRVEHAKGGNFTVAFADGNSANARTWLENRSGKRGEEPFVLEFRLDSEGRKWEYRFGRASNRQAWRKLPWSNAHRTSFWVASTPGEDGKQHLTAGLDEFPERRFFFAKVRLQPRILGFGPPLDPAPGKGTFYIRDVVVFGRLSLLSPPYASRDHFVELAGVTREAALEMLEASAQSDKVATVLQLPQGGAALLLCRSAADAQAVAHSLAGATQLKSSEWTWPPEDCKDGGVSAVHAHKAAVQECWARLHVETTRELAIFEEHLQRRTKHLEGMKIARSSAARMILGNLRGDAPLPPPPQAGV